MIRKTPILTAVCALALLVLPSGAAANTGPVVEPVPTEVHLYSDISANATQRSVSTNADGCRVVRTVYISTGNYSYSTSLVEVMIDVAKLNKCTKRVTHEFGWAKARAWSFDRTLKSAAVAAKVPLYVGHKLTRTVDVDLRWNGTGSKERVYTNGSFNDPCTGMTSSYSDKWVDREAKIGGKITDGNVTLVDSAAAGHISKFRSTMVNTWYSVPVDPAACPSAPMPPS
jgi:hypothetical protein